MNSLISVSRDVMHYQIVYFVVLLSHQIQAQAVFAHFMVENAKTWSAANWAKEIALAQSAKIDAFALNMRQDDSSVNSSLKNAFEAASCTGFKLFLSFDYAGGGPWRKERIKSLIKSYQDQSVYYHYNDRPFVSTFEGADYSSDWMSIKADTNAFLVPDWSSIGATAAIGLGVADGLFSWDAWPSGPNDMTTIGDEYYMQILARNGTKMSYMMPVSPWFFTNLPGYDKNWVWRGDDLWYDRWQQILSLRPEFVQILTWNDYGESHYIGPLHQEEYRAFKIGKAPFDYIKGMPHDGWRAFLPFLIDCYKSNNAQIVQEGLISWYRLTPKDACADGGTTGNVASHGQNVFKPADIVEDRIFYSALLGSPASVSVSVGGSTLDATWRNAPDKGIFHGSASYNASLGNVTITISRNSSTFLTLTGQPVTTVCTNGYTNWNAWVGSVLQSCTNCVNSNTNPDCVKGHDSRTNQPHLSQLGICVAVLYSIF